MSLKTVTVICPVRNEEKFIRKVINDLIAQDYPKDMMEVLFMDGLSTDNTKQIINEFTNQFAWIKVFDNAKKIVPPAMNDGIRKSKSDLIIRIDAHSSYPNTYISKLVNWLIKLNADNVGGLWITQPRSSKLKAKVIAIALSSSFGVGNALYRTGVNEPLETDTVPFGCYRREVFDRIGFYDERLVRNQDIELNKRLKNAGGKIFLVPDVYCTYFARDTFYQLAENNFKNGEWVILTSYYTNTISSLSIRHFIPLFFAVYILLLPLLALLSNSFIIPMVFYCLSNLYVSVKSALQHNNFATAPMLSYTFLVLHFSYGAGSFYGLWRLITRKI